MAEISIGRTHLNRKPVNSLLLQNPRVYREVHSSYVYI